METFEETVQQKSSPRKSWRLEFASSRAFLQCDPVHRALAIAVIGKDDAAKFEIFSLALGQWARSHGSFSLLRNLPISFSFSKAEMLQVL